jgi:hypothetical protein
LGSLRNYDGIGISLLVNYRSLSFDPSSAFARLPDSTLLMFSKDNVPGSQPASLDQYRVNKPVSGNPTLEAFLIFISREGIYRLEDRRREVWDIKFTSSSAYRLDSGLDVGMDHRIVRDSILMSCLSGIDFEGIAN